MAKKIQLTIAEPCHENWDGMTPVEKGKFCGSCQKQVVDFSNMSDRQVAEFFKKPSTGSVCGRFMTDQLDRPIEIPRKRIPWVRYFFQITLPAFLMSMKVSASKTQGEIKIKTVTKDTTRRPVYDGLKLMGVIARPFTSKPVKVDTIVKQIVEPIPFIMGDIEMEVKPNPIQEIAPPCTRVLMGAVEYIDPINKKEIDGRIVDQDDQPIPFASVETGKPGEGIMADQNGFFKIKKSWLQNGKTLSFSSTGYETSQLKAGEEKYTAGELVVKLNPNNLLKEVVVSAFEITCNRYSLGGVSYIKGEKISAVEKKEIPITVSDNKLFIYPNPLQNGTSLNISLKQNEDGYCHLQIETLAGTSVYQKEIWVNAESGLLNITIPVVAAGSYFLVLTNRKSGNKFTEKLIIQ